MPQHGFEGSVPASRKEALPKDTSILLQRSCVRLYAKMTGMPSSEAAWTWNEDVPGSPAERFRTELDTPDENGEMFRSYDPDDEAQMLRILRRLGLVEEMH